MDHFLKRSLSWICYSITFVLCFGFLTERHMGSSSWTRGTPCVERWISNHWTTREAPQVGLFFLLHIYCTLNSMIEFKNKGSEGIFVNKSFLPHRTLQRHFWILTTLKILIWEANFPARLMWSLVETVKTRKIRYKTSLSITSLHSQLQVTDNHCSNLWKYHFLTERRLSKDSRNSWSSTGPCITTF